MEQRSTKYSVQTLLPLNVSYDYEYRLNEKDVQNVNGIVEQLENERLKTIPKPGDMVLYTSKHGDYLPDCLIECYDNLGIKVITMPCIPCVIKTASGLNCMPGRGSETYLSADKLKYVGKTRSLFKIYGTQGVCRDGFVHFYAEVNLWEYKEPDPLYGEFTTKDWGKIYLRKVNTENALYSSDKITFRDEDSFQRFLKAYQGKIFPGNYPDQIVVWCYKDVLKKIPVTEWEKVNAPEKKRQIGSQQILVKIVRDNINHQVVTLVPVQESTNKAQ